MFGTYQKLLKLISLLPAWLKVLTLFFYLTKLLKIRQDSNTDQTSEDMDELRKAIKFAALAEAADEVVSILTQSRC